MSDLLINLLMFCFAVCVMKVTFGAAVIQMSDILVFVDDGCRLGSDFKRCLQQQYHII